MAACEAVKWLHGFREVPEDAAAPLAMSGPHPRAVGSYGPECIVWAKVELGLTLRWWQALAITRQLEHDADGALVWREIVESGPRRIGKSVRLRVVALWRLANAHRFLEPQLAMLVSKDLAVGKEIHRGAWRWAESKDWNVLRLNGAQEIETPNGDRWLLRAPNAAYGYDVGYGQVDESWGVDPQAITDGLEPALLERHSPQLHLTSTAHVKASSLMRRRLVAALRDADPDILLLLWGAHPDADVANVQTWRDASPHWSADREALIGRKHAAALAGQHEPEFDDPDPVRGWAAQYLNVWPLLTAASQSIMPSWPLVATAEAPGPLGALGLAMDPDRVWLSLAACSAGPMPHLGPVTSKESGRTMRVRVDLEKGLLLREAARIVVERNVWLVIDPKDAGSNLEDDLAELGVSVATGNLFRVSFDDYVMSCANLYDAVEAREAEHGDYEELNDAVMAAGWSSGRRRVWSAATGEISMLKAASLAMFGSTLGPPKHRRRAMSF